jgi:dTDP-4-amino-4,6-dideoxygalactose transaminase
MQIKMIDLQRQYRMIKSEIDEAIQSVVDSTHFILGKPVKDFESQMANYLNVEYTIGCASGTDALQVALMALGIGENAEVITSPFSFAATVETLLLLGSRPVFVDIDPQTYNLDVSQISNRITSTTKAILPVHLYGQPADMDAILSIARSNGLFVIEDTAQAIGARYKGIMVGTMGHIGCFSFFPSKNLGAYGDAGGLATHDPALAERCRMICVHGSKEKYRHEILGVNSRLDTLQAAILGAKLKHLESWTNARIRIAQRYNLAFQGLDLITPACGADVRHVYNQYSIRTTQRDALASFLKARGIAYAIHYPMPLHLQPAYRTFFSSQCSLPVAEAVSREIISLPIFPEMEEEEIQTVIAAVHEYFSSD